MDFIPASIDMIFSRLIGLILRIISDTADDKHIKYDILIIATGTDIRPETRTKR